MQEFLLRAQSLKDRWLIPTNSKASSFMLIATNDLASHKFVSLRPKARSAMRQRATRAPDGVTKDFRRSLSQFVPQFLYTSSVPWKHAILEAV